MQRQRNAMGPVRSGLRALVVVMLTSAGCAGAAPGAPGGEGRASASEPTLIAGERRIPAPMCTEGVIPDFPSPIPSPSARMAIPGDILSKTRDRAGARLRHAADELDAFLLAAGYSERAYFRLRQNDRTIGFALVTRMERIEKDGTPYPPDERFVPAGDEERFSIIEFLKGLFVAPVGYYRVLVFTVASRSVAADGPEIGEAGAEHWLATGATRLRGCVAQMPFTDDYGVDALIYEFRHAPEEVARRAERGPAQQVFQLIPSKLDPAIHLRKAGLLPKATRP